jgi:hypothetical protein
LSATDGKLELKFFVPIRLGRGENNREVVGQRIARVKAERRAVFLATLGRIRGLLMALGDGPPLPPCTVTFTRVAPGRGLDPDENLPGSCKAVKDELAAMLGVDDRDPRVTWRYQQERGEWGLWVHIAAQLPAPEVVARAPRKPKDLTDALLNHEVATRRAARGQPADVTKAARDLLAMAKPAFTPAPRRSP